MIKTANLLINSEIKEKTGEKEEKILFVTVIIFFTLPLQTEWDIGLQLNSKTIISINERLMSD